MKTLQQWLDEMDKLEGPEDPIKQTNGTTWMPLNAVGFYSTARTELPRAVKIIKTIFDRFIDYEMVATVSEEIEKILNEGGGEG